MPVLSKILDRRCIKLEMRATKKQEAVEELLDVLVKAGKLTDPQGLAEELLRREKLVSTGIGNGIAIPHKLVKTVTQPLIAFGRKTDGLQFNALDNEPVFLVFLILGPEDKLTEHLQLLNKLSRLLHDQTFKTTLLKAKRPEEILEAVRRQETE